jgi:hypothetical protein
MISTSEAPFPENNGMLVSLRKVRDGYEDKALTSVQEDILRVDISNNIYI